MIKIYHNGNCSKSRAAFEILREHGETFEAIPYLETPPSLVELKHILKSLNLPAKAIIRTGEKIYQDNYATLDLNDEDAILAAILKNPILLERPIVIKGDKAVIGRPPENLSQLWS